MNDKIAINTYLSTIEFKNQTKQTRRTETESWTQSVLMVARWEEGGGKWVKRSGDQEVQVGSHTLAIRM